MVNKVILHILALSVFLQAEFFYSGGKKIELSPTFSKRSVEDTRTFKLKSSGKDLTVLNEVLFKLKDSDQLANIVKTYGLQDAEPLNQGSMVYRAKVPINKALSTSNQLYKDNRTLFAHPNLRGGVELRSTNKNPLQAYTSFLHALQIDKLWELAPKRGEGIKVGIIDNVVEGIHEDLEANFVDVLYPNNITPLKNPSHGTSCAGIIGASDNSKGSVGIAPKVKIYSAGLSNDLLDVLDAIRWMMQKDVDLVNNSWGYRFIPDALKDAIKDMASKGRKGRGIVVIFASGNEGRNFGNSQNSDLSLLPSVIGVGATDEQGELTAYSNYGREVDIYAYGGSGPAGLITTKNNNQYMVNFVGTSAAAPVVTGVVALMLNMDPSLEFKQIRSILQTTADTNFRGYLRLNALKALEATAKRLGQTPSSSTDKKSQNPLETLIGQMKNIGIKKGWNMYGASYDIEVSALKDKFPKAVIYTQDRTHTDEIVYNKKPTFIKAGEGFWFHQK